MPIRFLPCGDTALTVEFGAGIDPGINAAVLTFEASVLEAAPAGVIETVPTYRSLTIHFDPCLTDPASLRATLLSLHAETPRARAREARLWRVPVVYGGAFGLDLDDVARHHGLTSAEVIGRHAAPEYRVAMIGFLPGYAYLAGLDPSLALSRRQTPRPTTPAGTVSIGGAQALIASVAAPSGWHLLGRTPVRGFMPGRDPVFLFEPGDRIRFVPTDPSAWDALDRAAQAGKAVAERA